MALSADGDTALIGGAERQRNATGAAWVFTRSGSTWTQQGEKLTGTGEAGAGEFGHSVALSADGNTALIGGPGDDGGAGAAWVFTRSGSTWAQQGEKLTGAGESGEGSVRLQRRAGRRRQHGADRRARRRRRRRRRLGVHALGLHLDPAGRKAHRHRRGRSRRIRLAASRSPPTATRR